MPDFSFKPQFKAEKQASKRPAFIYIYMTFALAINKYNK